MAHKFTKVLFAVEHEGKAYGIHLPADRLEKLLAEAARLSPSGSLEMYPMPNRSFSRSQPRSRMKPDLSRSRSIPLPTFPGRVMMFCSST